MTAVLPDEQFSQVDAIAPIRSAVIAASVGFLAEPPMEAPQGSWNFRLQSLQEWVCDLLIKNQQLRMALMEMKEQREGDRPTA